MISAHLNRQIFADIAIGSSPYYSMGEDCSPHTRFFPLLTHLDLTMRISDGQIPPDSMTHPSEQYRQEGE